MSFGRETIRVVQSGQKRVKIFIDFWNVLATARKQASFDLSLRWDQLAYTIVEQLRNYSGDEAGPTLAGCYIFGSYAQGKSVDIRLKDDILDKYGALDGLFFDFKQRILKETTSKCPECDAPVSRSSEAGVDVTLTVEMIKHASMKDHDYLALVSSDQDFLPLLHYLKDQGQRVIHVAPGQPHRDMRAASWKQVDLTDIFPSITALH